MTGYHREVWALKKVEMEMNGLKKKKKHKIICYVLGVPSCVPFCRWMTHVGWKNNQWMRYATLTCVNNPVGWNIKWNTESEIEELNCRKTAKKWAVSRIHEQKSEGWNAKNNTWAARVWRKVQVALPRSSFVVGPEDFPYWIT